VDIWRGGKIRSPIRVSDDLLTAVKAEVIDEVPPNFRAVGVFARIVARESSLKLSA
jgi:serine acetyltransferase